MGTTYRYASPGLHRALLRVFMALPTAVAVGFVFTGLSLAAKAGVVGTAVLVTLYWYHLLYLRTVCRLELTGTELLWWTPKRDGAIPLADVRGFCLESQNAVVNAEGHPRLFVHADPMLPAFLDSLRQVAPHVEVDPCLLAALDERFARGSAMAA